MKTKNVKELQVDIEYRGEWYGYKELMENPTDGFVVDLIDEIQEEFVNDNRLEDFPDDTFDPFEYNMYWRLVDKKVYVIS